MFVEYSYFYNRFAKLDTRDTIDVLCKGLKPARAAKIRLAAIIKQDRAACGDGRWVLSPVDLMIRLMAAFDESSDYMGVSVQHAEPALRKPHYVLEPRR